MAAFALMKVLTEPVRAPRVRLFERIPGREANGHVFFIKLRGKDRRDRLQRYLKEAGIMASPHYVPLHPRDMFGRLGGRFVGEDAFTTAESDALLRLPLFYGLSDDEQNVVIAHIRRFFKHTGDSGLQNAAPVEDEDQIGAVDRDVVVRQNGVGDRNVGKG